MEIAGITEPTSPEQPPRIPDPPVPGPQWTDEKIAGQGGMTATLVLFAVISGVVGLIFLFVGVSGSKGSEVMSFANTLLGIGLICFGCLLGILARIAQASRRQP